MKKLALAVITRNLKSETALLERLLDNIHDYVDGIYITNTTDGGDGNVEEIAKKYGAELSYFKWIDDFSAARNFNFSQVPEEYDYIIWSDTDDVWRGLENLKGHLESGRDGYAFWYLYHFDENKQPTVAHKKTMVVKNDGSFIWKGAIHEDMDCEREYDMAFVEDVERMHLTSEERIDEAKGRNERIAAKTYKKDKKDPRNAFNYGNTLVAVGKYDEARKIFEKFLKESHSEDEKYLVRQRLASIYHTLGDRDKAEEHLLTCVGLKPSWPDAFLQLGQYYFDTSDLDKAESYILQGLVRKPAYHAMIVFNPRDYDYNPMNLLAKVYFRKNRPDLALPLLEGCLKILPDDEKTKELVEEMRKEVDKLEKILTILNELKKLTDKKSLKQRIEELPTEQRSHPGICQLYNANFTKEQSTGKDVVIYCGFTVHEWNPELFMKKGFGGSEEAVVNLSKHYAKRGFNVEVYANVGPMRVEHEGVMWKPFWEFNPNNKADFMILWRSPKMCDYDLNADKIFIDLHDVINPGEFTKDRLKKIDKVFVKTEFHKSLFPNIPKDKFVVIPNGQNIDDFKELEKDPMLIINTSSPDRSMEAATEIFSRVKEQVPEAKFYWAYGWDVFDAANAGDNEKKEWKNKLDKQMKEAGVFQLGKIPQHEVAELYEKAAIYLYPTEFAEIDCISVKKAQLAGCKVIATDFGALDESIQHGVKIHSKKTGKNWCKPYQFSFGVEDEEQKEAFVSETVKALKEGVIDMSAAREFGKSFAWDIIGDRWINHLTK